MTVAAILNQQLWLTYFLLVVGVAVSSSALSVLGYSMLKYRRPRDAKATRPAKYAAIRFVWSIAPIVIAFTLALPASRFGTALSGRVWVAACSVPLPRC